MLRAAAFTSSFLKGSSELPFNAQPDQGLRFIAVFLCVHVWKHNATESERKRADSEWQQEKQRGGLITLIMTSVDYSKPPRWNSCTPTELPTPHGKLQISLREASSPPRTSFFFPSSSGFLSLRVSESQPLTHKVNLDVAHLGPAKSHIHES